MTTTKLTLGLVAIMVFATGCGSMGFDPATPKIDMAAINRDHAAVEAAVKSAREKSPVESLGQAVDRLRTYALELEESNAELRLKHGELEQKLAKAGEKIAELHAKLTAAENALDVARKATPSCKPFARGVSADGKRFLICEEPPAPEKK